MWPIWVGMMDAIAITTMVVMMMILIPSSHSLVFDLPSGRTKCISEDLRINAVAVGHFKIALKPPHNYLISSRVTDSNGDSIYYADSVESGEFAFTAAESGQYTICFWSPRYELSTSFPFEFEWKIGLAAKDWTVYVKKEKVDIMGLELRKLEETAHAIREEMIFLREREEEMQKLNENTKARMALLSFLSLFICLAVVGLQLWHLKSFFQRKKIL
ncbi:transmembrane emp24 domain-containing protein p24delta9-like isoform X1 [Magnolia sinica]|uniref:transmembrane emp24 domain-containing protein p24delta9-like isoform X1 n=1 Tax=Magnolia sinica TaxID=86752 RepID=UPI0026585F25|nr:transmembrane emp24 domain-containing protein p24delta9-like isoform X1 [Magnolia sinica]